LSTLLRRIFRPISCRKKRLEKRRGDLLKFSGFVCHAAIAAGGERWIKRRLEKKRRIFFRNRPQRCGGSEYGRGKIGLTLKSGWNPAGLVWPAACTAGGGEIEWLKSSGFGLACCMCSRW
jgi:hypothetical protein